MKRKILLLSVFILIVIGAIIYIFKPKEETADMIVEEIVIPEGDFKYGIRVDTLDMVTKTVEKNQVLSSIFSQSGIGTNVLQFVLDNGKEVFDPRQIRQGNTYNVFYTRNDHSPIAFVYEISALEYIRCDLTNPIKVVREKYPIDTLYRYGEARIESSLWNAMVDADIDPMLAMNVSDVFAWTIDFFGLQKGDNMQVIYEDHVVDNVSVGEKRICAVRFEHVDHTYYGFHYQQDSIQNYWDENGQNLRKAFLKAPLKYSRISSGFTYARRHPIYRTVRAHTGVDYAAPKGTPVMSIGDGTVIERGYKGDGGNTVKIRHNGTYTTAYLHLSKYGDGIKQGVRVKQGQIIGYVGSTGASTGPHLDFRVWQNGQPINPLKMESPPAEPIEESNMEAYLDYVQIWMSALNAKTVPDSAAYILR